MESKVIVIWLPVFAFVALGFYRIVAIGPFGRDIQADGQSGSIFRKVSHRSTLYFA
jgi:hypothetical protein